MRDWFRRCGLENIEYGSMCFFPSTTRWKRLVLLLEVAARIPCIKYLGGNLIVTGEKKIGPRSYRLGSLNQTTLVEELTSLLAAKVAVGAGIMARCSSFEHHHLVRASISFLRMLWRLTRIYATWSSLWFELFCAAPANKLRFFPSENRAHAFWFAALYAELWTDFSGHWIDAMRLNLALWSVEMASGHPDERF